MEFNLHLNVQNKLSIASQWHMVKRLNRLNAEKNNDASIFFYLFPSFTLYICSYYLLLEEQSRYLYRRSKYSSANT